MNIKKEIVDSIKIIVDSIVEKTCPQIRFGIVISVNPQKKCTVKINDINYNLTYYGESQPLINQKYPVFVPFGSMSLAFIMTGNSSTDYTNNLYYKSGDTYVLSGGNVSISGFITDSSTKMILTLNVPKSLEKINTISVNTAKFNVRCNSNYVYSSTYVTGGTNYLSGLTVSAVKKNDYTIALTFIKSSAFEYATNNHGVEAEVHDFKLTFT